MYPQTEACFPQPGPPPALLGNPQLLPLHLRGEMGTGHQGSAAGGSEQGRHASEQHSLYLGTEQAELKGKHLCEHLC